MKKQRTTIHSHSVSVDSKDQHAFISLIEREQLQVPLTVPIGFFSSIAKVKYCASHAKLDPTVRAFSDCFSLKTVGDKRNWLPFHSFRLPSVTIYLRHSSFFALSTWANTFRRTAWEYGCFSLVRLISWEYVFLWQSCERGKPGYLDIELRRSLKLNTRREKEAAIACFRRDVDAFLSSGLVSGTSKEKERKKTNERGQTTQHFMYANDLSPEKEWENRRFHCKHRDKWKRLVFFCSFF